jgi:hypothetical protein
VAEFLFYHDLSDRVVRAGLSRYSVIRKEPQSATRNLQPAGSAQEAGMFAQRSEMPSQWSETFAQWTETTAQQIEVPAQRIEMTTQWSEIPAQWTEMFAQWTETTAQWTEMFAQRIETAAQWTEIPSQRIEIPAQRTETGRNIPVRCTSGVVRISLATTIIGALHLVPIPEGLYVYRKTAHRGNSTPNGVARITNACFYRHGMPLASKSPKLVNRNSQLSLLAACSLPLAARSFCTSGVNRISLATTIVGALHLQPGTSNFKPETLNFTPATSKLLLPSLGGVGGGTISVTSYPSTANSGSVCNLSSNRCPAAAAITAISVLAAVGALWFYRYQCSIGPAARAQQKGGKWMSRK